MPTVKNIKTETWIIIGILITGVILRFWNFSNIPFTHDEFSMLKRLHFDGFAELIDKGVKIDAHPAGIHVFMYYWIQLFGESEIMVKFPFLIMGILSIWLCYQIGKLWFNSTVGIIVSIFIATTQFTIMYSQIARPYISGLFFSLLMVWYWSHLIISPKDNFWKNWTGFIIGAALCSYNHHFSLLFAAMVGLTGIFVIKKEFLHKYILSGLVIFALYIPHLSIFFYQLNIGGVEEWLAKPTPRFILDFITYLFHFSWYVYICVVILIGVSIWHIKTNRPNKFFYISIIWFLIPYLIGYYYSVYANAVLQYSVLIFSFPFLLFALFGLLKNFPKNLLIATSIILVTMNVFSLITERKHYTVFYENRFKQLLIDAQTEYDLLGKENCTVLIANHPEISDYYLKKHSLTFEHYNCIANGKKVEKSDLKSIQKYIDSANTPYFIYGCISYANAETLPMIKSLFPNQVKVYNYYASNLYVFSKEGFSEDEYNFLEDNDFTQEKENWYSSYQNYSEDAFHYSSNQEFGLEYINDLRRKGLNDVIEISAKVKFNDTVKSVQLVGTILQNDTLVSWSAGNSDNYSFQPNEWHYLHHCVSLRDLKKDNFSLKTYLWNNHQADFLVNEFSIKIRNGNPILYALTEDF